MNGSLIMANLLNENKRHLCRIIIALGLAFIVNHFYSFSNGWWLPLGAFFVMLTNTGSAIYQGVLRYVLLLIVVGMASWIFEPVELIHLRTYDITLGAFIGIIANVVIFPDRVDVDFRQSVALILKDYIGYFQFIVHLLLAQEKNLVENEKIIVEKALQKLPIWVYETGFDFALQRGYRYFIMKVNELAEILFSMHHLARYTFSNDLLAVIKVPLLDSVEKGEQFFTSFINVLNLKTITDMPQDFYHEIQIMENNFKQKIPLQIDILDISKEYVYLIEFIYNIRELQDILIKMAEALRKEDL
jgi:hypothetical protein